jgi:pilus assembly protein Flp/PilA
MNLYLLLRFSMEDARRPNSISWNAAIQGAKRSWSITMKSLILTFFRDDSGATAIEYGLIAAGIAIAIITAVQGVGTKLSTNFVSISTSLK